MMKNLNTKNKIIQYFLILWLCFGTVIFFSDLFILNESNYFTFVNPIHWIQRFMEAPILLGVALFLILLIFIFTNKSDKDFILEHEDESRLATEREILDTFYPIKIKEVSSVKKKRSI